jgi:hypothetical protein
VGSDDASVLGAPTGCTTTANQHSTVLGGPYYVNGCTITADNYDVAVSQGTLTVTKAHLTVTADNKTMTFGDSVPAFTVTFSGFVLGEDHSVVSGAPSCATTPTTVTSTTAAGSYTIHCTQGTLAADNYDFTSFVDGTLTVNAKGAVLGYTGNLFWAAPSGSTAVTLQGRITPNSGGSPDLTKANVVFEVFGSTNFTSTPNYTCPASGGVNADASGNFTCTITLGQDNWTVVMHLTSTDYFTAPDSDPVVVTVYQPTTDKFATGGGWLVDPHGSTASNHGNFGFTVRYKSGTNPGGQSVYVWRGADGYDYVVKSNSWQGGGLSFGTNTASFSGKATLTVINRATGQVISSVGNYTFRVDTTDNGSPGTTDKYAISVYAPNGTLYHQAGTVASEITIAGGNIVVHTTK